MRLFRRAIALAGDASATRTGGRSPDLWRPLFPAGTASLAKQVAVLGLVFGLVTGGPGAEALGPSDASIFSTRPSELGPRNSLIDSQALALPTEHDRVPGPAKGLVSRLISRVRGIDSESQLLSVSFINSWNSFGYAIAEQHLRHFLRKTLENHNDPALRKVVLQMTCEMSDNQLPLIIIWVIVEADWKACVKFELDQKRHEIRLLATRVKPSFTKRGLGIALIRYVLAEYPWAKTLVGVKTDRDNDSYTFLPSLERRGVIQNLTWSFWGDQATAEIVPGEANVSVRDHDAAPLNSSYLIRPTSEGEFDAVKVLRHDVYAAERGVTASRDDFEEMFHAAMKVGSDTLMYVAEQGGVVIGVMACRYWDQTWIELGEALIRESSRRLGIATALSRRVIADAVRQWPTVIKARAFVEKTNQAAISQLQNSGFALDGKFKRFRGRNKYLAFVLDMDRISDNQHDTINPPAALPSLESRAQGAA